ncbi:olfactory receptor 52R1-like [Pelodiscus sinensis]|uniref:olfactory receptor 52R1-like n=1 Tax=Pelodiscus sinensis TaxID=13735 RepID=UPI003F6B3C1B
MASVNGSLRPTSFLLVGIPGLEATQHWVAIPLCCMYIVALLGNCVVLFVIRADPSLHEPMYLFLAMLAVTDLVLCTSTVPNMLGIFWLGSGEIGFHACLAQMFFIHSSSLVESDILVAMALDRYVAICHPLRYTAILKITTVAKMALLVSVRGLVVIAPLPLLLRRLPFCQARLIPHSYCEHMAVLKLACADTTLNAAYGLMVALLVGGLDVVCIVLSYVMILRAVFRLPSAQARIKALSTCTSHVCVILLFYVPGLFSFLAHRFGQSVPQAVHILLANLYLLLPPMLNPIVYGMRTKQIRTRVSRVFYVRPPECVRVVAAPSFPQPPRTTGVRHESHSSWSPGGKGNSWSAPPFGPK